MGKIGCIVSHKNSVQIIKNGTEIPNYKYKLKYLLVETK